MKKSIISIFLIFVVANANFAQDHSSNLGISIFLGTSIKITPIYPHSSPGIYQLKNNMAVKYTDEHKNLTGNGLNYGIEFLIWGKRNLYFEYAQTIRYDHIRFEDVTYLNTTYSKSINELFLEHHIFLLKYFGTNKIKPFIKMGMSFLNNGIDYRVYDTISSSPLLVSHHSIGLSFITQNFSIGFKNKNLVLALNFLYAERTSNPFRIDDDTDFIIPEIHINYRFDLNK